MKNFIAKHTLFFMGTVTIIVFPLFSWLIYYFLPNLYKSTFIDLFQFETNNIFLLPIFLSIGIIFGLFVIWLTELKYFEISMRKYKNMLQGYKLTSFYVFFLSICAGFGEEVFFRGALQPLIGIWGTAIFFVAVHGYFSIKNFRINIFALLLTLFIALLGWSAQKYSLWLAIIAHFSYDLVLLFYYKRTVN